MKGTGTNPDDRRVPPYSWYALGVLFLVYLVNFIDRQILSILANDIKADLDLTDADLGFLYGTAFAIFYALFGIPLGRLADTWSRTRLLSLGLLLWSGMTTLSGFARDGVSLAVARVGVGVGEASANPCAYSLLSDWFPPRRRAFALSVYSSGLFLGSGLSLLMGGMIVEWWNAAYPVAPPLGLAGWQAAFIAVGLPGLVLAGWVLSLREPPRGAGDGFADDGQAARPWRAFAGQVAQIVPPFTFIGAARRGRGAFLANLAVALGLAVAALAAERLAGLGAQGWMVAVGGYATFSWAAALRHDDAPTFRLTFGAPAFMAVVFVYAAISYTGYTVTYWAAPYAERTFALSKSDLGWLIGAPAAVGGFLGVLLGGWIADLLHQRMIQGRLLVLLLGLAGPVPLVLLAYRTPDSTTFLICSFLLQLVTSSALGTAAAASQALVLPHMRGTATAIFLLGATLIGLAFGPFVAGYVSEATGSLGTGVIANLAMAPLGLLALAFALKHYSDAYADKEMRAQATREPLNRG